MSDAPRRARQGHTVTATGPDLPPDTVRRAVSTPDPTEPTEKGKIMNGAELIAAERQRQTAVEGWTPQHDDEAIGEELALAACSYAIPDTWRRYRMLDLTRGGRQVPRTWPWSPEWWKPTQPADDTPAAALDARQRDLVKAGALIAAEIDRLQRRG